MRSCSGLGKRTVTVTVMLLSFSFDQVVTSESVIISTPDVIIFQLSPHLNRYGSIKWQKMKINIQRLQDR